MTHRSWELQISLCGLRRHIADSPQSGVSTMRKMTKSEASKIEFRTPFQGGGQAKYPWDEILNGEVNVLEEGVDFTVPFNYMPAKIKLAARHRYLKLVKCQRNPHAKNELIVQSAPMDESERAAEDALREVEKAKRAAAKAAGESTDSEDAANEEAA